MTALSDTSLQEKTFEFKRRLAAGETLDDILPEAFAVVREASRRVLGMRHFDVQLLGGIVLHRGDIAEMRTGEGKTLVATLPVYLNALSGKGAHVVTVNDYLATRDSEEMGQVYKFLGLSVGLIVHDLNYEQRRRAYAADVTYGTNNEFGFDYLRDNMVISKEQMVQRPLHYCIVDEVDSILIDEARTPLIISGPGEKSTDLYYTLAAIVKRLTPEDYTMDEKQKTIAPTDSGVAKVEKMLGIDNMFDNEHLDLNHLVIQALRANFMMHRDKDYVVKDGEIVIVDEFTGRLMFGRRYSDGLHQSIEAKENVKVQGESKTLATITFQNYFRMYKKLSGMTGTAKTEEDEFNKIYKLDVYVIPTNRPSIRKDLPDVIYKTKNAKYRAVVREVEKRHATGQPILVGTTSINQSEIISRLLKEKNIVHNVLNAKYHEKEAEIIKDAGQKNTVTIATNMAGRGTDIKLGEGVPEMGGLMIIGTERHESRRIDNQLRGRSGRQGDPGRSKFFISMDDDLMRLFGGERMKNLMKKIGMQPGEPIDHPWLNKGIKKAQEKVEDRNFEIRKHLLDYDDVLNEQRTVVYGQRDAILADDDLSARVMNNARDTIEDIFYDYKMSAKSKTKHDAALYELNETIKNMFGLQLPQDRLTEESLEAALQNDITEKETLVGKENLNMFIRYQYIQIIDKKWLDQLETLESLRDAVALRSYGSKNPLTEYKNDGFDIFDEMLDSIRTSVMSRVFKVHIRLSPEAQEQRRLAMQHNRTQMNATHNEAESGFGASGASMGDRARRQAASGVMQRHTTGESVTVRRTSPKIGRNDPCPCGSGKKYKNCCGRNA